MAAVRRFARVLILPFVVLACTAQKNIQAVPCGAVIGKWSWFTKGVVTFNADGTVVHEPGNDGKWECTDANRGAITLRWRQGAFVNQMALSQGGSMLSSTDPSQSYVTGRKLDGGGSSQPPKTRIENPPTATTTRPAPAAQPEGALSDYLTTGAKQSAAQSGPVAGQRPQVTRPKEFHYDADTDAMYERALKVYNTNRAAALPEMKQAAERGHARAQAIMGIVYRGGTGAPKNPQMAAYWFEKAAAQEHRASAYHLGNMYELGEGVPQNHVLTVKYYDIAARQGMHEAQFELAFHHEFAQGTPRNRQLAIFWLTEAQKQGDGLAGWVASFLRNPRTPHFQTAKQLRNYIDAEVTAWVAKITPMGGGAPSSSSGGSGSSSGGDGCGGYTNYGACNAYKAGNDWAADRLQRGGSPPSERDWYGR